MLELLLHAERVCAHTKSIIRSIAILSAIAYTLLVDDKRQVAIAKLSTHLSIHIHSRWSFNRPPNNDPEMSDPVLLEKISQFLPRWHLPDSNRQPWGMRLLLFIN